MNGRKTRKLALACTLGLSSLLGCGDDNGDSKGGKLEGSLYAVMYEVYDDVGSNSYLALMNSIDGTIDKSTSREFAGGRAFLQTYNEWIFIGEPTSPGSHATA